MKFSLSQKSQNSLIDLSKPADVDADLIAQLVGQNLTYRLIVDGDTLSLFASGGDQLIEPRLILRLEIDRPNTRLVAHLIKRLEFSEYKNLDESVIQLGDIGPSGLLTGD